MKNKLFVLLPVLGLGLISCGDDVVSSIARNEGKWVGYVVDATTGEKLNFFGESNNQDNTSSVNQIYALVDGTFRTAKPCEAGDANSENGISQDGCFVIDNIPAGVELPVFVDREGYYSFASSISLTAGVSTESDVILSKPSLYANVRLFPTSISYDVTITLNDITVPALSDYTGVTVSCVYDNLANEFDLVADANPLNFLSPTNDFNSVITSQADSSGEVVISGDLLTKGAYYQCSANAADKIDDLVVSSTSDITFNAGIDSTNQQITIEGL